MSPAHHFHSEFGYFCPTPRFRRKVQIAVVAIVLCMVAGASAKLALVGEQEPKSGRAFASERPEALSAIADAKAAQQPAATAGMTMATPPSVPLGSSSKEAANADCTGQPSVHQTWAHLDGKCVAGRKTRARRAAVITAPRAASDAVAASAGALDPGAPKNVAITSPSGNEAGKTTGAPRKAKRIVAGAQRDYRGRIDRRQRNAYAYHSSPFEYGLFGRAAPMGWFW